MARSFAQMLNNIRKSDDVLRGAVSEAVAYMIIQHNRNNRKVDGAGVSLHTQFVSALPAWLQKEASRWNLYGKRNTSMTDAEADMRADCFVASAFASQEEKRRIAKENREARKAMQGEAAPKVEAAPTQDAPKVAPQGQTIDGEASRIVDVESALIIGGEVVTLSADEADAMYEFLMARRTPALKAA